MMGSGAANALPFGTERLELPMQSQRTCTYLDCTNRHEARGYCQKHYQRLKFHGDPGLTVQRGDPIKRFWEKVDRSDINGCWLWRASCNKDGYGEFGWSDGTCEAHHYSWYLFTGDWADGGVVRHTCDNPPCVNPLHLLAGIQADNVADMVARDRQQRGQTHSRAVLNEDDVRAIRLIAASPSWEGTRRAVVELGEFYGVSERNIRSIVNRESWKHID